MFELTLLSQIIALIVLVVVIIAAFFEIKGIIRDLIAYMLLLIALINYYIIYAVTRSGVSVYIYPLFIVEHYGNYGAFYPDLGQISLLFVLLLWRREIVKYVRALLDRVKRTI